MDIYTYKLLFSGLPLKINDQQEGSFLFKSAVIIIYEYDPLIRQFFGKIVMAKTIYNKKRHQPELIGILNSIN